MIEYLDVETKATVHQIIFKIRIAVQETPHFWYN